MVALKAGDASAFLRNPDQRFPVVLIYGRDAGGVSERADELAALLTKGSDDPFVLQRLDGDDLSAEPQRLAEEAHTIGLFGGRRVIRVRVGAKPLQKALEPLVATPPRDAVVVIEAGDLARSSPLRTMAERAKSVAVIACYADEKRDIARLIDEELAGAGLRIDADARSLLIAALGRDRRASRSEIAKIATFAMGEGTVNVDHVRAIAANVADTALDDLVDAAFLGDRSRIAALLVQLLADGQRPDAILAAASRHAALLVQLAAAIAQGTSIDSAVRDGVRYFRRQPAVRQQLDHWRTDAALEAMILIGKASAAIRRHAAMAETLLERCLFALAQAPVGRRNPN